MEDKNIILSVKDLVIKFHLRGQVLTAIRGASLDLYEGESLAIVGESGSGKSVFTKSFMGLLDCNGWIDSGEIIFEEEDISKYDTEDEWINIRGKKIAMVFQDPMTSLNPLKIIGKQVQEAIELHQGIHGEEAKKKTIEILDDVGINEPEKRYHQYPHEFSGGMRQRVVIAISVACNPRILICDEPTTALDVTIQAQILNLLKDLKKKYSLTTIYITHDLGVVANVADRIAVMYLGNIVELADSEELYANTLHPYSKALLSAVPIPDPDKEAQKQRHILSGDVPSPINIPKGCNFAGRCPIACDKCREEKPALKELKSGHFVACHLAEN